LPEDLKPVDISHIPELRRLVEEVRAADQTRVLQVDHEDAALLVSAVRSTRARRKVTDAADSLWNIVGLARSDGPGDVAEQVDSNIAEAYPPRER